MLLAEATPPPQVLAIGAALVGCDVLEPIIGQAGGGAVGMAKECGRYAPLVRMLAYTGLRWGEVAALRIHEVDLDRRRIHVVASVTEVDGRLVWGTPKTHAPRTVPLPRFVTRELALLAEGRAPDDLLFTAPRGGVLRVRNFRRNVFARRGQSRPRCFHPHELRHTAASLAIASGADVKVVQMMLGHKTPR